MNSILNGCFRQNRLSALIWALVLLTIPCSWIVSAEAADLPANRPDSLQEIKVVTDRAGSRLQVDGKDFMVFGMNWGYMPIGENYTYDFWGHDDEFIKAGLAREMSLLKAMGCNAIRHYVGMPPRWVQYVYETYGIYTIINHPIGRYGLTLDGVWLPNTDYSDPRVRAALKKEMADLVEEFQGTPGLLMWLLGNENNYGLTWSSFEIENLPEGERHTARAQHLYSLFGEIIRETKAADPHRPVAMANGDLQYIDIIAQECQGLDVMGSNVYRGSSARDFFQVIQDKMGIPALFTEFGADAFHAADMREDQQTQAYYLLEQWREIYEQSAGKGRVGNAIGGLIFQWSDGWWKYKQTERLDIHDTNASWANNAYPEDLRPGENNMNEEWWGITAKGYNDARGLYEVYPRAAYYALSDAFKLDPYAPDTDIDRIRAHFNRISPMAAALQARGDAAALKTNTLSKVRVSNLRMEFETYSTGGKNISTPDVDTPQASYPSYLGFDNGQSFYADIEAMPTEAIVGKLSLNVLGRVPTNQIDEISYENRGRSRNLVDAEGDLLQLDSLERVKVYQASVSWDDPWFQLDGFYRTGHLHWQFEGDFFGLYRDAFYGENVDIYNGEAPIGFEVAGKKNFDGLKVAFGPQLWWGANPALFVKYQRNVGKYKWTGIFQEDFAQQTQLTSSVAIPIRSTRKATVQVETTIGPFGFVGGGIWSGDPRVGESFQLLTETGEETDGPVAAEDIRQDEITTDDTFGVKGRLTYQKGRWNWYGQGAYMGLVAEAGPISVPTYTGWNLRDSGSGNQVHALSGLAVNMGSWQVGPNFLWQKPIVGPMPNVDDLIGTPGVPRNTQDDPFAVRGNRETTAGEIMITYDPTPATWMWDWDNDIREDAHFAASLSYTLKRHHTNADAGLFISDTNEIYAFSGGTPARDLWEVRSRIVNRVGLSARMISQVYFGTAEANGVDDRLVKRFGVESRIAWPSIAFSSHLKFNDHGPYDYHRDFNLTYPMQVMGDVSYTLGRPRWFGKPQTMLGVRLTYRTLDRYSNRYQPEGEPIPTEIGELYPEGLDDGREWEIRTYLHFVL